MECDVQDLQEEFVDLSEYLANDAIPVNQIDYTDLEHGSNETAISGIFVNFMYFFLYFLLAKRGVVGRPLKPIERLERRLAEAKRKLEFGSGDKKKLQIEVKRATNALNSYNYRTRERAKPSKKAKKES